MSTPTSPANSIVKPFVCEAPNEQTAGEGVLANLKYVIVGMIFGVIGTGVVVGMASVFLIKRLGIKTIAGEDVVLQDKTFHMGQVYGGVVFGLGWTITGACPGPLFAQIGAGYGAVVVTLVSAIAGTWLFGYFRERLPH